MNQSAAAREDGVAVAPLAGAQTATKGSAELSVGTGPPRSPELSRYFRVLALRRTHRRQPETPNPWMRGANGRRVSRGRFRVGGYRNYGPSVGETEEMSLLDPVMRQVLAQSQEPRRRQLDWLTALEERRTMSGAR